MKKLVSLLVVLTLLAGIAIAQGDGEDDLNEIARYSVGDGGELTLIGGEVDEAHEDLWIDAIVLLPTDYIEKYVVEFAVFESDETLAYVSELEEDKWEFGIALEDDPERALTVVHEFGHIVALNNTQYDTYQTVIRDNQSPLSEDEYYDGLDEDMANCATIAFEDGCVIAGSYLEMFTEAFWTEDAIEQIVYMELDDPAAIFFDENPDAFVSEYAATNPIEDFAETFSYFIGLDDADFPENGDMYEMDAKILWFEQFDEMVAMRDDIRGNANANGITFEFGEDNNYFYG